MRQNLGYCGMDPLLCHHFQIGFCRSCSLLASFTDTHAVENHKAEIVRERMTPFVTSSTVSMPIAGPTKPFASRAKAKAAVGLHAGKLTLGLLGAEFEGKALLDCPLHFPLVNRILVELSDLLNASQIPPYDVTRRSGELKQVIVISNWRESEAIVRFVLRSDHSKAAVECVAKQLRAQIPEVTVTTMNLQPLPAAILEGPEEVILSETGTIAEDYSGIRAVFGPQTFSQVTPETASALYHRARGLVAGVKPKFVLDLFCGAGMFSFAAAPHCSEHLGIELSKNAIECAKGGQAANGFEHLRFQVSDAEQTQSWSQDTGRRPDFVIVNPPRRGLTGSIVQQLRENAPQQILYSSCSVETLTRDLRALADLYELDFVQPFDMFPLTEHVEVLTRLRLR